MILIGCSPAERHTEQHDVFFGIGNTVDDLIPDIISFWPGQKLHMDAWREVVNVDGYRVEVVSKSDSRRSLAQLFFLNLGGYKQNEFEEFHYKLVVAAPDKSAAVKLARRTAFYRHTGFKGAPAHIDDKFGVDVDDVHEIADILPAMIKNNYRLILTPSNSDVQDEIHLGYFKLENVRMTISNSTTTRS